MKLLLISTVVLFASVSAIGNLYNGGGGKQCTECPPGYDFYSRKFDRGWCMKVQFNFVVSIRNYFLQFFPGNVTFFEAEKVCRCQGGATLSGIENTKELKKLSRKINEYFDENGIKSGGIWVGAYRRKDCRVPKSENKPECTKEFQYQWTDRSTIEREMWTNHWTEGAPHNNVVGNHSEFCVQLQVTDPTKTALNEHFDNRICVHRDGSSAFETEGFICGRPPKCKGGNNGGYSGGDGVIVIGAARPTQKP
ncbi:hypothetical protein B9Z55_012028 [Caenorhabditis nigoni]|uniref:C-type lectin domain-containing protein n=1 Tax=Caenorhabditis nigoni TaxID=1611254 RepID=A0A2G5TVE1_9PELO|nr:hypothetical protein B9Z55_012028 [Caenorhabditis nigoni]